MSMHLTISRLKRGFLLKVAYPVLMIFGAFMKGSKERLQAAVISLNNRLVIKEKISASKLLLLLPHCLQIDKCEIRLTHNVRNCKKCGKCEIKDLIGIADDMGLELFVATGGSLARRILRDVSPDVVVAVACERDLSSGISDSFPLPVYGIPNERPEGPCINTRVDLGKVKEAIRMFEPAGKH